MAERTRIVVLVIVAAALAGCERPERPIIVASKSSTEQVILGEIVAQHIEQKLRTKVERRLNLGGTLLLHQSLVAGQIDVYPEYAGSALTIILRLPPMADQEIVQERLKRDYEAQQLAWIAPLGFGNGYTVLVRGTDARAAKLGTLSEAAEYKPGWLIGAADEFMERPDGYPILMRTYGLALSGPPKMIQAADVYAALQKKEISMATGGITDWLPAVQDVKVLGDDKDAFPVYRAGLAARASTLRDRPGLRQALDQFVGKFSDQTVRRLNGEVDGKHRPAAEVAREFLFQAGL